MCIALQRPNGLEFANPAAFVELNGRTLMRTQNSGFYHNKLTINTIDSELCDESEQFTEIIYYNANHLEAAEYISNLSSGTIVLGNWI